MGRIDFNCFCGTWPFHHIRKHTFADLCALHRVHGIDYGYVSSLEAIFYQDPYEADARLAAEIHGSSYRQVVTVNPTLPGCVSSLKRMLDEFPVAGVRILPGFHGYMLNDSCLDQLYAMLCTYRLPLFLTLRMEDERAAYLFQAQEVPVWDVELFLSTHTSVPVLICNCRNQEFRRLSSVLSHYPHVCIDCSGLKNELFGIDAIEADGMAKKLVYGSVAPLFCMKSTILLIETAEIPDGTKEHIFSGQAFYRSCQKSQSEMLVVS